MLKRMLSLGCAVSVLTSSAIAQENANRHLGIALDVTLVSKYIWRGYDILDDHAAFQPSLNLDLFQTGFSANLWGSFALSSGFEDLDELDYTLAWGRTFFEDKWYALDPLLNYIYYDFPNTNSELADVHELGIGVALPNLLPMWSSYMVPSYYAAYDWPAHSGGPEEGWFHIFGLSYDLLIPTFIPDHETQVLSFATDVAYNDGVFDTDSGFSHSTVTLAIPLEWKGFTITPRVHHQWSFEDTINEDDEFWAGVSLAYSF